MATTFRITPSVPQELGGRALLHMSMENRDGELHTRRQSLNRRIRQAEGTKGSI